MTPSAKRLALAPSALAVMALAASALALAACARPAPRRPVLLVVVDTLRFDAGRTEEARAGRTDLAVPAWLARRGTHFTTALAASTWTTPSMLALMSGLHPSENGLTAETSALIPPRDGFLAERLHESGFATAAVVSNLAVTRAAPTGFWKGFDVFDDDLPETDPTRGLKRRGAAATTDAALARLGALTALRRPWFLWVHYLEPHGPYTPPEGYYVPPEDPGAPLPVASGNHPGPGELPRYQALEGARGRNDYLARYRAHARYALDEVDRLLSTAEAKGWLDDAVVVFTSDHGELLGEVDLWFQHQVRIDPALVHVPLVVARGKTDPLRAESRPVSHVDLFPTLLRLGAGERDLSRRGDDLFAPEAARRHPILVEYLNLPETYEVGVVTGERLLVQAGPNEARAFAWSGAAWTSEPATAATLGAVAPTLRREGARISRVPLSERALDPEVVRQLKQLGYLKGPKR